MSLEKLDILNVEQGSEEWLKAKLGVISASNIGSVLAKKGTVTREGYMMELIAQVATGEMPELSAKSLEWGKNNEAMSRSAYEMLTSCDVEEVGFIYGNDRRYGVSPDGIIKGERKGIELKNPWNSKVHAEFLALDKIKPEYVYQVQFGMFVTGFEHWDFASYDGRFRKNQLKLLTLKRDLALMDRFENEVGEFVLEMDVFLKRMDIVFGEQLG